MAGCRGCSTQEEVEAASLIRRQQIRQWQAEQLAYDRAAHGLSPEPIAEQVQDDHQDNFWDQPVNEDQSIDVEGEKLTLVGTMQPQPDIFEPEIEEKPKLVKKAVAKKVSAKSND